MKSGTPWSVKGIDRKARETAKVQARKQGMTLGQWLNNVIAESGSDASGSRYEPGQGRNKVSRHKNIVHAKLEKLSEELALLAQNNDVVEEEPEDNFVYSALEELARKVERSERQTANLLSEFKDDLNLMAQSGSGEIEPQTPDVYESVPDAIARIGQPGTSDRELGEVEKAMSLVVDHIEITDKQNAEALSSMQTRLSELSGRLSASTASSAVANVEKLNDLEERISNLANSINQESGSSSEQYMALESKVLRLNKDVQASIEMAKEKPSTSEVEPKFSALKDKLNHLTTQLSATREQVEDTSRLEPLQNKVAELAVGLERISSDSEPAKAISRLNQQYEELASRINETERQLPDPNHISSIEGRLRELALRLDKSLESSGPDPQISELETRVNELTSHLAKASDDKRLDEVLPKIDTKFLQLNKRLSQTESRFKSLDVFEERIGQLFKGLDQARETAAETARAAAQQAAQQAAEQVAQQTMQTAMEQTNLRAEEVARAVVQDAAEKISEQQAELTRSAIREAAELAAADAVARVGGNPEESKEMRSAFNTLERGLDDVRANTDAVEKRTQETLETVHNSLEKVVDRLTKLETRLPEKEKTENAVALSKPQAAKDERIEPDLLAKDDHGLGETLPKPPSSVAPKDSLDHIYGSAALTQPASPPTKLPGDPDKGASGLNRNEDFIAAARRAAQTAAHLPPAAPDTSLRVKPGMARKISPSTLTDFLKTRRKALMMGVAAVAVLAGAYVLQGMFSGSPSPADGPVVSDTPPPAQMEIYPAQTPSEDGKASDETSEAASGIAPEAAPEAEPEATPGAAPEATPGAAPDETPEAAAAAASDETPEAVAEAAPDETPEAVAEAAPDETPEAVAEAAPDETPEAAADVAPDETPEAAAEVTPEVTSEDTPEAASEAAAAEAPDAEPVKVALANSGGSSEIIKSKTELLNTGDLPASIGPEAMRTAAIVGNPAAQYEIGQRYAVGKGVAKDMKIALNWYRKAAARGLPMAQYRLGSMYEKGSGIAKDRTAARIWYRRAADHGNRKAMHNLAVIHAEGQAGETRPDFKKASQWFRKAANMGLTDSQFNLAILSERGLGVPQDKVAAYKWFAIAAQNGDMAAEKRMDKIAGQMSGEELEKAKLEVKNWKQVPIDTSSNNIDIPAGGWANAQPVALQGADKAFSLDENMITSVQSMLKNLGYKPGPTDGAMGQRTRQAIRKFQSNEGLPASGEVDSKLFSRLKAASSG